ncbi:MAG: peptidylprolyl isomerase [Cytophagaceae bacterium]
MAIFNRINKHSGVVVTVIALGLVLFLVGGEIFGPNSYFNQQFKDVGEIDGKSISYKEFSSVLDQTERDYIIRTDRGISESERPMILEQAWNRLINDIAFQNQYDKLGVKVPNDELADMIQGRNIHPTVRQLFSNPQTQQFDEAFMKEFFNKFSERPERDRNLWFSVQNGIAEERLRSKFMNLFKKSVFVTTAEAQKEYESQNSKAEARYLYVPFYAIPDTAVVITDGMLKDYLRAHENEFKVEEGRTIDYVVFTVNPAAEDTAYFQKELQDLKRDFALADNDTSFVQANSDNPGEPSYKNFSELPEQLKERAKELRLDSIYGPLNVGNKVQLVKVIGTKNDSVYTARASHILFDTRGKEGAEKEAQRKKANEILSQIRGGASFEQMAREHGADGTASRGGDLGWFTEGQMVKPFNDAVFNASSEGLLPRIVETEFGFHLIKITGVKTNKKYLLAIVEREIEAGDATRDMAFRSAEEFAQGISDTADFNAKLRENPSLVKSTAMNLRKSDRYVNNLSNAREIVRWAYNDAKIGKVSPVFTLENQYVVAILTGKREKNKPEIKDLRDELTAKVRNEKKAEMIIAKLNETSGDFQAKAAAYGSSATTGTASDITLGSNSIQGIGYDPVAVGKLFGLKQGQKTGPFKGEYGVVMLELVNVNSATEIADYGQYKNQLKDQRESRIEYMVDQAIRDKAEIEDNRVIYY